MKMGHVILQTEHLKKHYGSVHAVEDVSLSVRQGEIFGFLGSNGAGKTTTISMILGLIHPTAGEIQVFGERVTPQQTRVLRRVGTLVGTPALQQSFSAYRNVRAISYLYPEIPISRIDEVLELVGLQAASSRVVRGFSTGMKQRLGLALALFNRPEILILDEPTNGMDPAGVQEIRLLLRSLAQQGTTILLSSHLLHEMQLLCDHVAVIQQGYIIAQGAVKDLLGKGSVMRLQTTQPELTEHALHELPNAHHIQRNGVNIDVQGVSGEQIIEFLVARGLTPKEVTSSQFDLESVFLELTSKKI